MQKIKISKFLQITLEILFVLGIVCFLFLPQLYNLFKGENVSNFSEQTIYYRGAFYLCYFISLMIILELIHIFNMVYNGSPFNKKMEYTLKRIAILFMVLSVIVLIKLIFIPTILSGSVAFITFIAGLSFYVLSQVFKVAIHYKDEVDYTV